MYDTISYNSTKGTQHSPHTIWVVSIQQTQHYPLYDSHDVCICMSWWGNVRKSTRDSPRTSYRWTVGLQIPPSYVRKEITLVPYSGYVSWHILEKSVAPHFSHNKRTLKSVPKQRYEKQKIYKVYNEYKSCSMLCWDS